ncbi:MAG: RagB/SusD family nutrient uptake outer membrane protein [Bacteroidetes bacterium]|nr:RagB/SusD family nutrient uptake outer membrane protein [Bacteroidota bacterium]
MKNGFLIISIVVLIITTGCDVDEFLDKGPLDEYSSSSVFKTEADMIIASNKLYTFLPELDHKNGEARVWVWTDDGWNRNSGSVADLKFLTSDKFLNFYRYEEIRECNEFIARVPGAEFTTPEIGSQLAAEARFIRAMLYERMVFIHGDIPLVIEPQSLDFFPERAGQREVVFDFILDELDEITGILPASYSGVDEGRITKWAALALKARACLNAIGWHSNPESLYDMAESACQTIISQGGFSLDSGITGFQRLFLADSDIGGGNQSNGVLLSRAYIENVLANKHSANCLPRGSYYGTGEQAGNNQAQYGATWNIVQAFQTINGLAPVNDPAYNPADPFTNRDPRLGASFILPGDQLQTRGGAGTEFYNYTPHPKDKGLKDDMASRNTGMDTGYLVRKYSGLSIDGNNTLTFPNSRQGGADFKIIRYAEVLLMMAECKAADNNFAALDYINMVRERVGMPSYESIANVPVSLMNGTTGNVLIDAVLLERRYEFSGEAPHRWVDIWRYKLGTQVYGPVEGMPVDNKLPGDLEGPRTNYANTTRVWDDKFYLFPLPLNALDINPNLLPQNPGW